MSDLHIDSKVSEEERDILESYGATATAPVLSGKKDLVITEWSDSD
ncbi:MAG: hypothetical protein ABRQ37_01195 [Candidatus Eremiobacterota bacterium]